jgi:hypothetical protein
MRGLGLLAAAALLACRAPAPRSAPSALRASPPRTERVLDSRSFAFDVTFLPDRQVGCALLEQGEHRLVRFARDTGRRLSTLRLGDGQDLLTALAVSPSGRLLAASFRELRESGEGRRGAPKAGGSAATPVRSSTPALELAGSVVLVELSGGRVLRRVPSPRPVLALQFLDEEQLALGTAAAYRRDQAGQARPHPGSAGVCLLRTDGTWIGCATQHADSVTSLTLVEPGLASGSWDGTVRLWGRRLEPLGALAVGAPINALASAPRAAGGLLLAVATSHEPPRRSRALTALEARGGHRRGAQPGDRVELWSLAARQRLRVLQPHRFWVTELAVSPDARWLATGSWDFSIALQHDGGAFRRLDRFSQIVTGLALSPEADALAVAAWTEQGTGAPSCLLLPLGSRLP